MKVSRSRVRRSRRIGVSRCTPWPTIELWLRVQRHAHAICMSIAEAGTRLAGDMTRQRRGHQWTEFAMSPTWNPRTTTSHT